VEGGELDDVREACAGCVESGPDAVEREARLLLHVGAGSHGGGVDVDLARHPDGVADASRLGEVEGVVHRLRGRRVDDLAVHGRLHVESNRTRGLAAGAIKLAARAPKVGDSSAAAMAALRRDYDKNLY